MRRCGLWVLVLLVLLAAGSGCQSGKSPPPDMAEWELDEAPKRLTLREDPAPPEHPGSGDPSSVARSSDPSPLGALIGRTCSVQFRRDALGMAAGAPLSPTVETAGGRPARLRGTLTAVGDGWITLSADGATYHIPQATILLIETGE